MPGIATGETYSFTEGRLYLYASASGATSGSGIGFVENAQLAFTYGWQERGALDGGYQQWLTGKRATLKIDSLYCDQTLYALAQTTGAVNAVFEGRQSGGAALQRSAQFALYSGAINAVSLSQAKGDLFKGSYSMHAREWSAFGQ